VTFTATGTADAAFQIALNAGNGQSATVNTAVATAPSVIVRDQFSNPVAGHSVTFTVTGGGGSINPASPAILQTITSGIAAVTSWTLGTTAGSNTLQASSTGVTGSPVSFTATGTPGPVNAGFSSVVDNAATITACSISCTVLGGTADSITVTVRDQFANPISGASVTISATGTSNTFSPAATGTSNASGVFAARLSSTVAQAKTISATANAVGITQTAAVTVNPAAVSASTSSVVDLRTSITACSTSCTYAGLTADSIIVTVRDAFSNLISGSSVTVTVTGTGNTFNPSASGTSNASGIFATKVSSTVAQAKTISATASAVSITQTAAVTVNAAAPSTVTVTNQGFSARVGTGVATRPTYTVRDAFANLVLNFAVTYSSSGGGTFAGPSTTNASGQATLTSWTMGGTAADDVLGRMANTVTLFAGSASGTATDYGIYTWALDADPLVGSPCTGCHDVVFDRNPNTLVSVFPTTGTACDASSIPRVTASSATNSVLYRKLAQTPTCGVSMPQGGPFYSAAQLKIIRAWINNGALNN
jgi:adhesin/invasin